MAQLIKVTPEILRDTARSIEDLAKNYQELYNELFGKTARLSEVWSGDDNVAFTDRIAGFKPDLENMYELMTRYVNYLRQTAQAYEDTQKEVIRRAGALQN